MSGHEHEVWQLLDKLQMDHRAMGAKLTELRAQVAALKLPPPNEHVCPEGLCRLTFRSAARLAEHLYVSHDGPLPAHYESIEGRSAA